MKNQAIKRTASQVEKLQQLRANAAARTAMRYGLWEAFLAVATAVLLLAVFFLASSYTENAYPAPDPASSTDAVESIKSYQERLSVAIGD